MVFDTNNWLLGLFTALLGILYPPVPITAPSPPETAQTVQVQPADPQDLLVYINDTRKINGLSILQKDQALFTSAAAKCSHMVDNNYWAHSGGGTTWDVIVRQYVSAYPTIGEILAKEFHGNLGDLYVAWMNSPTHKQEIVRPVYTHFGLATCNYSNGQDLTVVHFGG